MAKYKRQETLEEIEENVNEVNEEVESNNAPQIPEETWEKRYGDLRRYANEKERQLAERLKALEDQLNKQKEVAKPPVDENEFKRWLETYPTASQMMQKMIEDRVAELDQGYQSKMTSLKKEQLETKLVTAKAYVVSKRPKFPEVVSSNEFKEFIELAKDNPRYQWVVQAIVEPNLEDPNFAETAITAFDFYVQVIQKELGQNKSADASATDKSAQRQAATAPKTSSGASATPKGSKQAKFSESMINAMSIREYEKNEQAIKEAIAAGEFDYDMSR
jgi:hypothetical protein